MILQPDTHGLLGDPKKCRPYPRLIADGPCQVGAGKSIALLGAAASEGWTQQIRLHFQCAVLRSDDVCSCHHGCTLAGFAVQSLMQQPVCQLMSAGKAQSACGGILSAEGAIDEYGAALDRNDGISWDIVIIDNGAAIIKNRFAQDTPGFPQALIFQRDPLCFDDVLDRIILGTP
mgnify:CR=1 FL=1